MIGRPIAGDLLEIVTLEEEDRPDGMVLHLGTGDGRGALFFLPIEEVVWLIRSRHPSFRRHIEPFIARMASTALQIELVPEGCHTASAALVYSHDSGVTRSSIALSTAILIASRVGLSFFVHPRLLTGETFEEVDPEAFRRFLETYKSFENLA